MLDKLKYWTSTKFFHIVMIIVIVSVIFFVMGIMALKYSVEGETNMPFDLTKISVISSSGGKSDISIDTKWKYNLYQTNDIYFYIEKNSNYKEEDIISSILINNINIEGDNASKIKIYKPNSTESAQIFINDDSNIVSEIEYKGGMQSNFKTLEIGNQGGLIAFRCINDKLGEYTSDENEIVQQQLLAKAGITNEQLQAKVSFDFIIKTETGKEYKSNICLDIPVDDVVKDGTTSNEIKNSKDFIFKRIKN